MATAVDGKADQMDVEALKVAMQRLDAANKARGNAASKRDAEAIAALQAAYKNMSTSMEESMRKLEQVLRVPVIDIDVFPQHFMTMDERYVPQYFSRLVPLGHFNLVDRGVFTREHERLGASR